MNLSAVNRSVVLLSRLFDPGKSTQSFLPMTQGKPLYSADPTPYFLRTTPEAEGVSSTHLAEFLRSLNNNPALRMHTVTILRHGHVICEANFGAQDRTLPKYTFSACKSVVSLAVGILIGEGKLSPDEKIVDIYADRINAVQKLRLSGLTVAHLLTMQSGIVFNELESQTDEDWVKCFLNSAVNGDPGTTFAYNSLNTYMLAAILVKKTGMSLSAFLQERLYAPMGIRSSFWECCPRGIEKGGWGLYLYPEDMAKLGMLVLRGGQWEGKQLVPQEYIARAASPLVLTPAETGRYDYGYQMWVGQEPRSFLFNGMLGQNVLGFPDTDILIVSNAGNDEMFQQCPYYDLVTDALGSQDKLSSQPLPENPAAAADLRLALTEIVEHTDEELRLARDAMQKITEPPVPTLPEEPEARSFFSVIKKRFFGDKQAAVPQTADTPVPASSKPQIRLPADAALFLDRTFSAAKEESTASAAVGLLPMFIQAVQSNYTQGFCSIAFSRTIFNGEEQLLITYTEADDTHIFAAGIEKSVRTTLYFHGVPYIVAAKCTFTHDEDGRPVCKLRCDFLETPHTRLIKLFLNPEGTILYRQEELPGAPLVCRAVVAQKVSLTAQPVIGTAMEKIDNEYLSYRIRRTFSPELILK